MVDVKFLTFFLLFFRFVDFESRERGRVEPHFFERITGAHVKRDASIIIVVVLLLLLLG